MRVISQGDNEEEGLGIARAQLIPKKVASSLSGEVVTLGDGGKPEEKVFYSHKEENYGQCNDKPLPFKV